MSCSLITSQNADISALAAAACTLHTHSRFLQLIQPAFTALMVPRSRRKGRRVGGSFLTDSACVPPVPMLRKNPELCSLRILNYGC